MSDNDENVNTESANPDNVTVLADARKRKERSSRKKNREEKDKAPKQSLLYQQIYSVLIDSPTNLLIAAKFKLAAVQLVRGFNVPVRIINETCQKLSLDEVAELVTKYVYTELAHMEHFGFTPLQIDSCVKNWFRRSEKIKDLPMVLKNDEKGLCWNRLPFVLQAGPTPNFDELFSRMTNSHAVKAWIASTLINESYDQQYVYLVGSGGDGKSSLMEFVADIFGSDGSLAQFEAPGEDKHWAEGWIGKRFIYFPDFENVEALKNGPLKQITGGDKITVRPMYRPGTHSFKLPVKVMISSQKRPKLDFSPADKRRLIYSEIAPKTTKVDSRYREKLAAEGGAFLFSCMQIYNELCPDHGEVPVDPGSFDLLEELRDRSDLADYQLWFGFFFVKDPTSSCTANEVADAINLRFGSDYKVRMGAYSWLARKGFTYKQYKEKGKSFRCYKGIRRKQFNNDPNSVPL